ncbi:MAG: decaprenyl-phosphate phosphoribosyltransferase [Anaerolineaceae bacterium 4572_78]|nr:MAG: decaprenyl-phosphate phosphoribosyltransferase [Anaerolineaceae bacterium 4572_78]
MIIALLKTMRPKQWTKNVIIFAALVFDEKLFDIPSLINTLFGFVILCFISGTVYLINDIVDIEKDKAHPKKRHRPLPSGAISKKTATIIAIILPLIILPFSFLLNINFGLLMVGYLLLQLAYSFKLKHVVIIDVFTIAAGFVIRVGSGALLIDVSRFSPWLYVCTTLLALLLGFGKRRQELLLVENSSQATRPILNDYSILFLDILMTTVTSTTIMAYSLYTFSAPNLPDNHAMMLTIPLVIYSVFRYLQLIYVQKSSGDPSEVLLKDHPLQVGLMLWGLSVIAILYFKLGFS